MFLHNEPKPVEICGVVGAMPIAGALADQRNRIIGDRNRSQGTPHPGLVFRRPR
jgi:hypothetical protein